MEGMEREAGKRVELGFGTIFLNLRGFEFRGHRGSVVQKGDDQIDVAPAAGFFRVAADRFIKNLGEVYFKSLTSCGAGNERGKNEEASAVEEGSSGQGNDGGLEEKEVLQDVEGEERKEVEKPYSIRFTGDRIKTEGGIISTSCTLTARRKGFPGVRFTVVQVRISGENREVIARTTGVITPHRLMAVIDALGDMMRQSLIYPLGSAVLVADSEKVLFQSGTLQTELEKWQEAELKYLLTGKFFIPDVIRLNFRAGRVRIEEVAQNEVVLTFGGVTHGLSFGDMFVLWSVLGKGH